MRNSGQWAVGSGQSSRRILLICWLLLPVCSSALIAGEDEGKWAILLAGVSGDQDLQKLYLKELTELRSTLENSLGFPRDHMFVLFEDPSKAPDLVQYKSTRENFQEACRRLSERIRENDLLLVFLEGHGDYDGKVYKLNLVGPDPTAEELADTLYKLPARFVIVNVTNCSGGSVPALSRKGTVLITSTRSGMEKNQTHMGQYFAGAFKDNAADSDKNGRVSILEAFLYSRSRVENYYSSQGNLQTEHPVLDDNGDTRADANPGPENGEGLLARTTFLDAGTLALARNPLSPNQQKLSNQADELEKQIEALKYSKGEMPEAEYEKKLEELLLKLAQINEQLSR